MLDNMCACAILLWCNAMPFFGAGAKYITGSGCFRPGRPSIDAWLRWLRSGVRNAGDREWQRGFFHLKETWEDSMSVLILEGVIIQCVHCVEKRGRKIIELSTSVAHKTRDVHELSRLGVNDYSLTQWQFKGKSSSDGDRVGFLWGVMGWIWNEIPFHFIPSPPPLLDMHSCNLTIFTWSLKASSSWEFVSTWPSPGSPQYNIGSGQTETVILGNVCQQESINRSECR